MTTSSLLRAIRLRAALPRALTGMALIEALVAAALLGLALSAYILLAREGAQSAAFVQKRIQLLGSAETLLNRAHGAWPEIESQGIDPATGAAWLLTCERAPLKTEADRLALVTCAIRMQPDGLYGAIGGIELRASRAHPRQ